jgi:transposase-like protein
VDAAVTPLFADAARPCRHATGDRWFVDETYVKVAGRWRYLYRAVDQFGQVIDVFLSEQRDTAAARRFFTRALTHGSAPVDVTTDKAGPYLRVPPTARGSLHRARTGDLSYAPV